MTNDRIGMIYQFFLFKKKKKKKKKNFLIFRVFPDFYSRDKMT